MKKILIATLTASAITVSGAAFAFNDVEIEDSYIRTTDITNVDVTEINTDITTVDYEDESLNINGNDLFSHNVDYTSVERTDIEIEDSFNSYDVSSTSVRSEIDVEVFDNDGFNTISMRTDNNVAVNIGDTAAVYSYRPDNATLASNQNDFGDLHKISVTAVGAMAGPSISVGRSIAIER